MSEEKRKAEAYQQFRATRRDFLKLGGTVASLAGLLSVLNKGQVAEAAAGGAVVRDLGSNQEGWLGTSEIVGPIGRVKEVDTGFNRALRGQLGADAQDETKRFVGKYPLSGALSAMRMLLAPENAVDGPVAAAKLPIPDPERMSKHIKDTALFLRADMVGIGLLPPYAVYSHKAPPLDKMVAGEIGTPITLNHKYAIGILIDQDLKTTLGSNGYDGISASQSMMAYFTAGAIACSLAAYIRNLGYPARAHHCGNYQLTIPPVLIACGLGEMSRTGECVLNPVLGFRTKAAVVTTDLPLVSDGPIDFGLRDFCSKCLKCADHCPAQAITRDRDQIEYRGYKKWRTDADQCVIFRTTNWQGSSCGRCMKVCPWNNKEINWYREIGAWAASRTGIAARLLRDVDDLFGYGTEVVEENRWWLEWPELYLWKSQS